MIRFMISFGGFLFVVCGAAFSFCVDDGMGVAAPGEAGLAQAEPTPMPLALKVVNTQVLNSRNGRVRLRGVNAAGLEWSSDGEGHILDTVRTAIQDWHANVIRLPLAQDRWFGQVP